MSKQGGRQVMARHTWTAAEDELVRSLYSESSTRELAARLGCSIRAVYLRAVRFGVRKSKAQIGREAAANRLKPGHRGRLHQFKPGQQSWNAGRKLPGWTRGRMAETQFRAGAKPHTWRPLGSERFSKEGYLQRKVTDTGYPPRDWVSVHILLWQEAYGPVPAGHAVCFRDGNKTHVVLDNLELVSRRELMLRNTVHRLPKEMALAIQMKGALNRKIRRLCAQQNDGPAEPSV